MKRLFPIAAALALVLAACGSSSAAVVGGTTISTAEVAELLVESEAPDAVLFGDMLYQVIVNDVITDAAADQFGFVVTDEEIQNGITDIEASLAEQGSTLDAALANVGYSQAVLPVIVRQDAIQQQLAEHFLTLVDDPSDEQIQASFDSASLELANVCASHILLETEEDAQAAFDRAVAGEDFAALATELSTGPSGPTGGDLGCSAPSGYVGEFAQAVMEAPIGEPFGPVQTQFGFHVILVEDRTVPTIDEFRAQIVDGIRAEQSQAELGEWYIQQLRDADVQIADEYGTWTVPEDTTQPPTIVPNS